MNWPEFWEQSRIFDTFMSTSTKVFANRASIVLQIDANSIVLDIGCGPGYLEEYWLPRVKKIVAADTSRRYVQICRQKFNTDEQVKVFALAKDRFTDFTFLGEERFTHIIFLSVLQYYPDLDHVKQSVLQASRYLLPGGKILLADLPDKSTLFADMGSFLLTAWRGRFLIRALGLLWRCRFSSYHQTRQNTRVLDFDRQTMDDLFADTGACLTWLEEPLTTNPARQNLLIQLP
ncbi:MAG: class I SAM-dependent methyltransferase [Leptospiraceae bacterium]|nr:class I SAM-dependent methyltransferase [Leptospiraceae bacterium]